MAGEERQGNVQDLKNLYEGRMIFMEEERQQEIASKTQFHQVYLTLCIRITCQLVSKHTPQHAGRGRYFSRWSKTMTRIYLQGVDACFAPSVAACGNKVDPVYETLRFGTSLAQKTKKSSSGSGSDSPNRNSVSIPHLCSIFFLEEQQVLTHRS